MRKVFIAIICIFSFTHCQQKLYSLSNLPKQFIEIGSYGGFAGTAKSFFFLPNGQRFMNSGFLGAENKDNANEIEKMKPKAFKEMLSNLKKMNFDKLELNEIGNMTYFVKLKTKKTEKKIQWNNMDTAPPELVQFYREALKNIKPQAIN
jgi:hypothetical protein